MVSIVKGSLMITIVHIHYMFYPYEGGSTSRLLNLIEDMDSLNYMNIVISKKLAQNKNYEVYKNIEIWRYKFTCEIPWILYKINKKRKIDIIHAHNYRPGLWASLSNLVLKKVLILEMHSIYKVNFIKHIMVNWEYRIADKIIVLSNTSKDMLIADGVNKNKIFVIYNGINIESFRNSTNRLKDLDINLNEFLRSKCSQVTIGYIGSIQAFQGIDNLISIINSVKNDYVKFLIVGGNESDVNHIYKKLINKNVYVRTFVKKEFVSNLYKNIDILIMTRPIISETQSAIPLKPIEALAAGVSVLSTEVEGMLELKKLTNANDNQIRIMDIQSMITYINNVCKDNLKDDLIPLNNINIFDQKYNSGLLAKIYKEIKENDI